MTINSRRRAFARNVDFSFIVSGRERTFTFRVLLNTLPTLATLVRDSYYHSLLLPEMINSETRRLMVSAIYSILGQVVRSPFIV